MFSSFFKKEEPHALGIDIGSSAIKIVQLKKKNGQAVLETYGELSLGPYGNAGIGQAVQLPPDKLAQALIDLMKEKEVNVTTKKCGLSIPFASSLMSVIEMPEVSGKQLSVMVPLEARRYIPVPISEVMLDWSIIPKGDGTPQAPAPAPVEASPSALNSSESQANVPKVDVLVVAIHKDTIGKYQNIVTKAGLEAGFFEIEIFSTMRSVLDSALQPVLVMDMGAASTKVYIVERGIIRTSHTVNRGSQDITSTIAKSLSITNEEAEVKKRSEGLLGEDTQVRDVINLVLDYIFSEVNTTMLAFEKKYNKTVSKVILVGGGAALKGLKEVAKTNFKTEVETALPFNKVSAPAFLDNILRETGPEFAVAIGLALRKLSEEQG
jgi:type IV pilus assembly protein PilM